MGDFSADWLRLREPADYAARSAAVTREVLRALPPRRPGILDLACGTGSNLRYLREQIQTLAAETSDRQTSQSDPDWLLVDHDPTLLALVPAAPNVRVVQHDLRSLDAHLFEARALVTASALLDLVSESWLRELASHCRARQSAALFALSYDGRLAFEPAEPGDALIRDLVNRHQKTDKGFGPALGPAAVATAADLFRSMDYVVRIVPSDWVLSRMSAPDELQDQLIKGWAEAAAAVAPDRAAAVDGWRRKRLDHVARGRSLMTIGHQDLAAMPS
jgi:SAM-dependent methyltransferase